MKSIYVIDEDRRNRGADQFTAKERRINQSISRETVDKSLENQKWEFDGLSKFIDEKEKKKIQVTHMSYGVFTLLGGLAAGLIALISKYGADSTNSYPLFGLLVCVVTGASLINMVVVKYIAMYASELTLANRQLNCIRHSIHFLMYMAIEGMSPPKDFPNNRGNISNSSEYNQYFHLIGAHVKYPFDNEELRMRYFKWQGKAWVKDIFSLYRCSDLFAICAISFFTICLLLVPIAISSYGIITKKLFVSSAASFVATVFLTIGVISIIYITIKVIKTFQYQISKPLLIPNEQG